MCRASKKTAASPPAFVLTVTLWAVLVLTGCSLGAQDQVLVEGQDWQLAVSRGPELAFREGDKTSGTAAYKRPVTLSEASTFFTKDGTTVFAGPVSDKATEVTVATRDGGESQGELVVSEGVTWFWVQLPGEHKAARFLARDEAGDVIDEYTVPGMPFPDALLVEPRPL